MTQLPLFPLIDFSRLSLSAEMVKAIDDSNMSITAAHSIEVVHEVCGKINTNKIRSVNIEGISYRIRPERVRTFIRSHKCSHCDLQGQAYLGIWQGAGPKSGNTFALMGTRGGRLIHMTVDHILPDSFGGKFSHTNFVTMCEDCNRNRGNSISKHQHTQIMASPTEYKKSWIPENYFSHMMTVYAAVFYENHPPAVKSKLFQVLLSYRTLMDVNKLPKMVKQEQLLWQQYQQLRSIKWTDRIERFVSDAISRCHSLVVKR